MADYLAAARTNYVRFRDLATVRRRLEELGVEVSVGHDEEGRSCLIHVGEGGWPSFDGEDGPGDMVELLAPHLVEGEVCVMMEAGAEATRYLVGVAVAFNNQAARVTVSLDDVYARAAELGDAVTRAEW